jgi:flagellar protein FliO/FliZ
MAVIRPDQILILILFLGALGLAWLAVQRNRAGLAERLGRGRRLRLAEAAAIGPGDRAMILAVDGREFLVLRIKGAPAVVVPLAAAGGDTE